MLEEGQLLEGHLNETHVLIFVVKDTFFNIPEDKRVLMDYLIEVILAELANGAVLESDD